MPTASTTGPLRVAAAKYVVEPRARGFDFDAFARKQADWLDEARGAGARWAVLPEYLSLELAAAHPVAVHADLLASLRALQAHHDDWRALYAGLARSTGMHVTAGSFLLEVEAGRWRNRSYHFAPDGGCAWQDKLHLTGFEKRTGVIDPGDALKVFDGAAGRFGIAVCYDSEFPLPVRAQCEAGARVIAVPSCTDTEAGATRVRVGCMARALENRCFVVQSVTAGQAPWSPALDANTGEATIHCPMDVGLPPDGVLARTHGEQRWAIADLDFAQLDASRADAQVANDLDWPAQSRPAVLRARLEGAGR